ncbi:Flp family type IVb pilin [Desulfofalx alkaliphila]|uniref:Flp family type IVb pilin n=1 Tax=Desulfofalx alkaliphila TaxID=105483 RepID=UPI0004E25345|nr:hypothetical protein [Desulfofalx alkaliphila]
MLNLVMSFIKDERGNFIENGLWIIIVVLLVAGASVAFATNLSEKFKGISNSIKDVNIEKINN